MQAMMSTEMIMIHPRDMMPAMRTSMSFCGWCTGLTSFLCKEALGASPAWVLSEACLGLRSHSTTALGAQVASMELVSSFRIVTSVGQPEME